MRKSSPTFGTLLESIFLQRLLKQRAASEHTIRSYRDTFKMLLQFARKRLHKQPERLELEDIDAPLIVAFLEEMEKSRDISARSRNLRLAAIRSFFRFVAFEVPEHSAQIPRVRLLCRARHKRRLGRRGGVLTHRQSTGAQVDDCHANLLAINLRSTY